MRTISLTTLRHLAFASGFSLVGVVDTSQLEADKNRLKEWQSKGMAGEMLFMNREPELLASPMTFLASARSVVVFSASYDQSPAPECPPGFGRVARYAWGRDYHRILRRRLEGFVDTIRSQVGDALEARVFSDSVPLLERALARSAGVGFVGKNTMLITPGIGSFTFLCEIIWNVEVEPEQVGEKQEEAASRSCGSCTNCLSACPTGAFTGPFTLDARRCIAYLTIETRTALTPAERTAVGSWVFGCDICQEVCPFNYTAIKSKRRAQMTELREEAGVGPLLDLAEVLKLRSHEQFVARFGGTAIMRAKRAGLLRNAAIVAGNTCAESVLRDLMDAAKGDSDPLVRQHAIWGAASIARQVGGNVVSVVKNLCETLLSDSNPAVQDEVLRVLAECL